MALLTETMCIVMPLMEINTGEHGDVGGRLFYFGNSLFWNMHIACNWLPDWVCPVDWIETASYELLVKRWL